MLYPLSYGGSGGDCRARPGEGVGSGQGRGLVIGAAGQE